MNRIHLVVDCPCSGHSSHPEGEDVPDQEVAVGGGPAQQAVHDVAGGDEGCTPSKLQKLSLEPMVSPSDKLSSREQRSNV